ncbi:flagellar type III secretion system pore protein FliP [Halorhodospira halochloris]|uniref:Flagellar biosynthetic protein FliP n=1 Tax=Halorhodospira halochloris TaxID=1052 RepID=A0A0X8XD01_HALHR|nr:flagellar type III secretion system pore protein FliP [Halorhodospira halochloris]MBK1651826.1 flagellar biosynthetic protein FliP [Halorhodospira halochloris]MCG5529985.1 flagellar type III secretion system pore protein FliP [Halorhodospira halochloris]MCG5548258.1 flagellar type III secretion system pore protein FliP [Halorhodospira halochloris]BAU58839.1 flagellar biosynthesis protein FliP [Halorhodospira halochloris]
MSKAHGLILLLAAALFCLPLPAFGQPALEALTIQDTEDGQTWSLSVQILVLMTLLTMLPAMVLMMTAFTRIIVVLAILRQAMGTASTPSNQVLIGLALFLTVFVMMPVFDEVNEVALQPYLEEELGPEEALQAASQPMRDFMIQQTREDDIALFLRIADYGEVETPDDVPMTVLIPAFMTSELKTAFIIGFILYLPFLVIDLVVASTLMSMGMLMLSPMIISLPFKIMLFVLVDGWSLIMGTLAASFFV